MKDFVLVAHGSPSDPDAPDAAMKRLAEAVARHGLRVHGATLAKPGSLQDVLTGLTDPVIYPFFMAEGWFTRRELPRRLAQMNVAAPILRPFGLDPDLPALIARVINEATKSLVTEPESTGVILVAHGSRVAQKSKDSAYAMADHLRNLTKFKEIEVALIEEPPFLADIAAQSRDGLCLPFFALRAGHVADDIPRALAQAGFTGTLLPAIGEHPEVPALIAAALLRV